MPFCASCGAEVQGSFCPACGKPVGAAPGAVPAAGPAPVASAGMQENMASMLCYLLGLITGVLFLVLEPYNKNRNIRFHAFQSIFLHVGLIACWIVLMIVRITVGLVLGPLSLLLSLVSMVLWLGAFVLWVVLLVKTHQGAKIVLPIIGPLAEKQAGA